MLARQMDGQKSWRCKHIYFPYQNAHKRIIVKYFIRFIWNTNNQASQNQITNYTSKTHIEIKNAHSGYFDIFFNSCVFLTLFAKSKNRTLSETSFSEPFKTGPLPKMAKLAVFGKLPTIQTLEWGNMWWTVRSKQEYNGL